MKSTQRPDKREPPSPEPSRLWSRFLLIRFAVGFAVAGGLIYAVIAASGGMASAITQIRTVNAVWLFPALLAEGASYAFFSMQLRRLSGTPAPRVGWWVWPELALVVYGLGSLTPASPAEGIVFSTFELHRLGMTARRAGLMLVLSEWTQVWALILVFAIDRIVVRATGDLGPVNIPVVIGGTVLLLGLTALAVILAERQSVVERLYELTRFVPGRRRKSMEQLRAEGERWHHDIRALIGSHRNRRLVLLLATGGWVGDAACLWMALTAVHAHIGLEVALFAYTVAVVVAWIPLLPAGLGVVEIALPALLHRFGVPLIVALAGTLVWRFLSLFLPALAGAVAGIALQVARPRDNALKETG